MAALSGLGAPAKVAVCVVRLFPAAYGGKSRGGLSALYGTPLVAAGKGSILGYSTSVHGLSTDRGSSARTAREGAPRKAPNTRTGAWILRAR